MNVNLSEYKRVHFDELGSTNDFAKLQRKKGKNLIVSAAKQTDGHGTKGRSFSSADGGVYVTKLTFYPDFPAKNAFEIMKSTAAAVCQTLVFFGLTPQIKWPNDVFVNGKKICGILIENALSGDKISSSIVGVGLNVCNSLPKELAEIATSMQAETGGVFSVDEVREVLIHNLCAEKMHERYEEFLGWLGERVTLVLGDTRAAATLLSVDDDGGLWAEINGEHRKFVAAEVSVLTEKIDD